MPYTECIAVALGVRGGLLVDRYLQEGAFVRVPEFANRRNPVLAWIDWLLDDNCLYAHVRTDLGTRYPQTLVHDRYSTPAEEMFRRRSIIPPTPPFSSGYAIPSVPDCGGYAGIAGEHAQAALQGAGEPRTPIIPRHRGGAAVEFGQLVVLDGMEGGIRTRFAVLEDKIAE